MKHQNQTNLAVFAALEKGCHADEADIVVPHDGVDGFGSRHPKVVLEDWPPISIFLQSRRKGTRYSPSKLSLPVFS